MKHDSVRALMSQLCLSQVIYLEQCGQLAYTSASIFYSGPNLRCGFRDNATSDSTHVSQEREEGHIERGLGSSRGGTRQQGQNAVAHVA